MSIAQQTKPTAVQMKGMLVLTQKKPYSTTAPVTRDHRRNFDNCLNS
jgi:hypothetical protein